MSLDVVLKYDFIVLVIFLYLQRLLMDKNLRSIRRLKAERTFYILAYSYRVGTQMVILNKHI